jgi:hypothetical protein
MSLTAVMKRPYANCITVSGSTYIYVRLASKYHMSDVTQITNCCYIKGKCSFWLDKFVTGYEIHSRIITFAGKLITLLHVLNPFSTENVSTELSP